MTDAQSGSERTWPKRFTEAIDDRHNGIAVRVGTPSRARRKKIVLHVRLQSSKIIRRESDWTMLHLCVMVDTQKNL